MNGCYWYGVGKTMRFGWCAAVAGAMLVTAVFVAPVRAATVTWDNGSGGDFSIGSNWTGGTAPGADDNAVFDLDGTYTVDFTGSPTTNRLTLNDGDVTFDLNTGTYNLKSTSAYHNEVATIGEDAGDNAALTLTRGTLSGGSGDIGVDASASGKVTVTGPGAAWQASVGLSVGDHGNGMLQVLNGGQVNGRNARLGLYDDGIGSVTISDPGSTWTDSQTISVGNEGDGTVLVEKGGEVNAVYSTVGDAAGSTGSVTVTGAGSSWTSSADMVVGNIGSGTLLIENDAHVKDADAYIAHDFRLDERPTGKVIVTGRGSTWTTTGDLEIGIHGDAALMIEDGGQVTDASATLYTTLSTDTGATVTGDGSSWVSAGSLKLHGQHALLIEAGGKVSDTGGSANGDVTITGDGSTWTNSGNLEVGDVGGEGTVSVKDGGLLTSDGGSIGYYDASEDSTVTVTGTGSKWTNDGSLYIYKKGTLNIEDGGQVTNADNTFVKIHDGSAAITGAGSTWSNSGELMMIGGNLTISDGGKMTTSSAGEGITGDSTIIVRDAGSSWVNSGDLELDSASFKVLGGASVSDANPTVTGDSDVSVAGGTWLNSGQLTIASTDADATFAITDGGVVTSEGAAIAGESPYGAAAYYGTVQVLGPHSVWNNTGDMIVGKNGQGALEIKDGGSVTTDTGEIGMPSSDDKSGPADNSVTVTGAGSTWTINKLLKVGNDDGGEGSLVVSDGGHVSAATTEIRSTGTLEGGGGTLTGEVVSDGLVSPGDSPGVLTVDGTYEQNVDGTLQIELAGPDNSDAANPQFDVLNVNSASILAGTLDVSLLNGFMPQVGDTFNFLTAGSITGTFDSVTLPDFGDGVTGLLTYTPTDVALKVALLGDLNGDGFVGVDDLNLVLSHWGQNMAAGQWDLGDPSGDGFVGVDDMNAVLAAWGRGQAPAEHIAAVPGPGSAMLVLFGLGVWLVRSRRGRVG